MGKLSIDLRLKKTP